MESCGRGIGMAAHEVSCLRQDAPRQSRKRIACVQQGAEIPRERAPKMTLEAFFLKKPGCLNLAWAVTGKEGCVDRLGVRACIGTRGHGVPVFNPGNVERPLKG